jgi:hypothetical protein
MRLGVGGASVGARQSHDRSRHPDRSATTPTSTSIVPLSGRDPSAIRNQDFRGFQLPAFMRKRIFQPTYRADRTEFKCSTVDFRAELTRVFH